MKNNENMRIDKTTRQRLTGTMNYVQFTRAGGFKGTAIKPMWANKQMTEFFGPCGIGWGMTEPHFEVQATGDEIMVTFIDARQRRQGNGAGYRLGIRHRRQGPVQGNDRGNQVLPSDGVRYP